MEYICGVCGKITPDPYATDGEQYYCSRECVDEEYSITEEDDAIPIEIQNGESALNPRGFGFRRKNEKKKTKS